MFRKTALITSLILYIASLCILLLETYFPLYLSLLFGSFIDMLVTMGSLLILLASSLMLIFIIKNRVIVKVIPVLIFGVIISLNIFGLNVDYSRGLYYSLNKERFSKIEFLLNQNPNLVEMSDLKRYYKNINNKQFSDEDVLVTKEDINKKFGQYLNDSKISVELVSEIRELMDDADIIQVRNYDEYLVYTIDGFIDNEYGLVKFKTKKLNIGDTMQPWDFIIINLQELGDGWFYWAST